MRLAFYKLAVELVSFDVFGLFIAMPFHFWFLGHSKLTQVGGSNTLTPGNIQFGHLTDPHPFQLFGALRARKYTITVVYLTYSL